MLVGTAASVLLFCDSGASQEKPADPLTASERALAAQIVLEHQELGSVLAGKRLRLLRSYLAAVPRSSSLDVPLPARRAQVIVYNYTDDVTLLYLVDLGDRALVGVEERHIQPSMHLEELEQAFTLAKRDARTGPLLEGHQVLAEGLIVTDPAPGAPCFTSRCVDLQFIVDGEPSSLRVVVNLSIETVVRVRGGR
jgi:hypothetical protein